MKTDPVINAPLEQRKAPVTLTPLSAETRHRIPTPEAARHLNRQPQTLRCWAMYENGPLRPIRVHGRLAWAVADIKQLLGV
jgi:hypothetical protein